ncbi:SWIM zinc finger domain-containing protein [Bacillus sp. Bva_UNVM-123]|uniref:SWIM zinc finger domain-containing protein n=1 Tax=Bacillus sp. Bva_UNVM-123 TaxID=2829798 RepID=UPI00391FA8B1
MMIPERFVEPLQFAAKELMGQLRPYNEEDERLVQKGLLLFRQRLVYQLRFESDKISATVQDVTPAKVVLDLDFIHLSECSCPVEGFCRHKLAVFFQLLSHARSVSTWVEEWRQPLKEKKTAKQLGLQTAKDLLRTQGRLKPDYDTWIAAFNESFDTILEGQGEPKPYIMTELYQVYERRWKAGAPFEQEWKLLYSLIGYVFSFQKLMKLSVKLDHPSEMINRYYIHLFHDTTDEIAHLIDKLSIHSLPFAFDEFIEKLKQDSTALVTVNFPFEYERTYLYRLLWTKFFKKKAWYEEEIRKLQAYKETNLPIIVGIIHLHILAKEDETALEVLAKTDKSMTPYMLYWIEQFTHQKDWQRMGPFIETYINRLNEYLLTSKNFYEKTNYTKLAIKAIAPYCEQTEKADLYEKALIETLPYCFSEYESFLFERKAFTKWLDLHGYTNMGIVTIPKERLKILEKEEPACLLPLYHHAVQDHIARKGRDNYRDAVRKMKKLRTLYKKLKRQDEWEFFLETLLEKTKRLRAFQEECQRGKLIDA